MRVEILLEAENELLESIEYYEEIEPGLGLSLRDEFAPASLGLREIPLFLG